MLAPASGLHCLLLSKIQKRGCGASRHNLSFDLEYLSNYLSPYIHEWNQNLRRQSQNSVYDR